MANQFVRKHKRKRALVVLSVAPEEVPEDTVSAAILDISSGGCSIETTIKAFAKKERIVLRFTMFGKKIYAISGEVRRAKEYTCGVQFDRTGFLEKIKRKILIHKLLQINY